jgi:hypothetical protein
MANYNIYIIDPFNEIKQIVAVAEKVNKMFDPIAIKAGFSGTSTMFPQYQNVQPMMHEVMVYVCPFTTSVVKKMYGTKASEFPDAAMSPHQGVTHVGAETASEIWCKFSGVDFYAAMIFHEIMHNKMQLGQSLHGKFRSCEMSCASIQVSSSNAPTQEEIDGMAAALPKPVKQWTGGLSMLWSAAQDKANGNDLWSLAISG